MSEPVAVVINGVTCETGYDVLACADDYERSCPCCTIRTSSGTYELHCWRVCRDHPGCGVHYEGGAALAWAMKPLLDEMDWYGEWTVVEGLRRS
jgi:hypothetical protein